MTTTIVPATGQGILFAQQGPGTTPGYSAVDERRSVSGLLQEGVYGTSTLVTAGGVASVGQADFMVTQRNAGANMSVDVNMPAGGCAWVQGDTINGQGLYGVPVAGSNINEVISPADATNPRIDQVILEIQDNVLDATGGNQARTRVLTGTPTPGATLSNRSGAQALPGNALLLADVLVPNSSTSIPNSNIRDRRKWARGAYVRLMKTTGNVTTTTSMVAIDTATLVARLECSGVPLRITMEAIGNSSLATDGVVTGVGVDGVLSIDGISYIGQFTSVQAGISGDLGFVYDTVQSAGSHLFTALFGAQTGGTATCQATSAFPTVFTLEEIVRQTTANNTVTSG